MYATSYELGKDSPGEENNTKEGSNEKRVGMAGACPAEMSTLTRGRAVQSTFTAREALLSLPSPHRWYVRDPTAEPTLSIGVEVEK